MFELQSPSLHYVILASILLILTSRLDVICCPVMSVLMESVEIQQHLIDANAIQATILTATMNVLVSKAALFDQKFGHSSTISP